MNKSNDLASAIISKVLGEVIIGRSSRTSLYTIKIAHCTHMPCALVGLHHAGHSGGREVEDMLRPAVP